MGRGEAEKEIAPPVVKLSRAAARKARAAAAAARAAEAEVVIAPERPWHERLGPWNLSHRRSRFQGGEMLFQRLGHLNPVRQDAGGFNLERSPERKGIWAFPFPYFDMYFAYHKYEEVIPAELSNKRIEEFWESVSPLHDEQRALRRELQEHPALVWRNGFQQAPPEEIRAIRAQLNDRLAEVAAQIEQADETLIGLRDRRDAWIKTQGRKAMPLRKFWYSGEIYSHFHPSGDLQAYDAWSLINVETFHRVIGPFEKRQGSPDWAFEIFIPHGRGKIR